MNEKAFKIFVDFDGTITKQDVGELLVNTFGKSEQIKEIIRLWMEEKITSPESWIQMLATMSNFSIAALEEMLKDITVDPFFNEFVLYCKNNNYQVRVLSDGFDIYINRILRREGLLDLEVYSNKVTLDPDNMLIPSFPYGDEECKFCGNCKRNHLLVNSADEDFIVYIGDGYSDKCPIQYCDFIFAKGSLLRFCEMNRISYFPFEDFSNVISRIDQLRRKRNLKKKHQAELKRKEVFKQG
ncbi:MAG: MtnX-like HAD-IB family phosphatase [Bacteroidota bacterium]|nr:MtnX-like HAD-IB family phosphatase [Bacteroidota bacterium]MDP4190026.1 MtnX-like HAD-IB family phosphatase [Bacteroidota bacterium]